MTYQNELADQNTANGEMDAEMEFYGRLRSISMNYSERMRDFLDEVLGSSELLLRLTTILLQENDEEFLKLTKELKSDGFSRDEFLFWLSYKEIGDTVGHCSCLYTMEDNFERLKREGREEEITALLNGDSSVFYRIKEEDPRLREDDGATYEWFVCSYMDTYYGLRYCLKAAGVVFPSDEDEDW